MGYRISSLAKLPIIPGIDLYVFVLQRHQWEDGFSAILERNFSRLAKNLGPRAAIVAGHDGGDLRPELVSQLEDLIFERPALHKFASHADYSGSAFLILGAHPKELQPDDLVLYAPISETQDRSGGLELFFDELCDFANCRSSAFLARFEEKTSSLNEVLEVIEIKPTLFGVGFNINKIIEKVRQTMRG